ncbi:tektin-2 [Schistocerca cancellata]|uniref:tektin-2 n=1 Tax=Schistocerca cancellata TaxID=274614 RepID=UPI002117A830|nr:tektin-2 [Schistocerca cancellata]XP_049777601.1 tektin-2 [Schistocerca cancellata]XP_049777603.1 tektin-2 [Schistocerca cancellata]XP_049777604.1 tektin-2 [Schistocerca cancellata]XP_049777605.1 tektin-2 [Schistocerca cancellata]XP_049777606.1 tektin-2 [Schistocerca cancellata]XP_049777607.1 tektin-2 [Schistocerca cancellata]XP_049777608.1 tektin-2 [Schistocerca cancellata]XP_049777609.1 tektin-2 [Schistocerca cancellata]
MCDRRPEKPVDHVTVADWDARIQELRETARRRRKEAHDLRQESIQLRADTAVTTHWSLLQSSQSLQDRCTEVRRVEHLLELKRAATVCEMERLEEEKAVCQRQLELLSVPRAVTVECQLAIDQRLDTDLLRDPVHLQLQKELGLIEQKKNDLEAECKAAWEQLQRLGECLNQLSRDLQNKGEAIEVDESALGLKPSSSGIGFRQDPTRHPKECIPYETWQQVSESNMNRAEEEIQKSRSQRLNMFSLRADVTNSLHAQHSDTDHALSRRIYEVQRAHDELQWQKEETENEMGIINREISLLEEALADKTGPSKLAESRLEIRLWRPRAELLYDDAQQTIKNELLQLQLSRQKLTQQIADAKATYNALQQHSARLAADINCKNQALTLLNRCCDIRSPLHPDER